MEQTSWEMRAHYMRALAALKIACDREINAAQVGELVDTDLFARMERVKAARSILMLEVAE